MLARRYEVLIVGLSTAFNVPYEGATSCANYILKYRSGETSKNAIPPLPLNCGY